MSLELISQRAARRNHDFAEKKFFVEQTKWQRVLSPEALSWPLLKHYPSIFLDQRLRSGMEFQNIRYHYENRSKVIAK